jgi:hypothetical protein
MKVLEILLANYLLWVNIAIPFAFGIYFFFTHQEYDTKEFAIQVAFTTTILWIMFFLGYSVQDISTTSYESGKVNSIVYEEEWTELVHYIDTVCTGSGKYRSCISTPRTRHDFHPDSYYLQHDFGSTSINEHQWNKAKNDFDSSQTDSGHSGQSSYGDGRTYTSIPNKTIPVVSESSDINYIYASKTNIIKSAVHKDLEKRYHKELVQYPELNEDTYGNYTFNRVFNAHLVDDKLAKQLNNFLSTYASLKGHSKQVNPIVYFTTATDREFVYVIKGYYRDAHKNDAVLVVSVTDGNVNWIDSFGLTKNAEFFVQNRAIEQKIEAVKSDVEVFQLFSLYRDNIDKHWKREPMSNYKYLSGDIDLPIGYEIFIVLFNLVGSFFLFRYFFNTRNF